MKPVLTALSVTLLSLMLVTASASASVLYSNGAINGTINAWNISQYTVADSFTLSAAAGVNNVDNMGLWVPQGSTAPLTVDWAITSQPLGGTIYGSGTATLSDTFLFTNNNFGYDIYSSNFVFSTVNLAAGTYYLNLTNATGGFGSVYWDENDGPSTAFQTFTGQIPSESFEITGNSGGSVPEPASLLMLGSGLLTLGGIVRKRMKA